MSRLTSLRVAKVMPASLALGAALALAASPASSRQREAMDPGIAREVVVGEPAGAAPMAGVSRGRIRATGLSLPDNAKVLWRTRVEGPIRHEPVVDERGQVVVSHGRGRLSQLDDKGKVRWSERLGDAMTATGPALMSDGTRAVLEHDHTLLRISPEGQILSRHKTRLTGTALPPLPTQDGGLALAAGHRAVRVSHLGEPTAEGRLDSPIVTLLGHRGRVYLVARDGSVHRFFVSGRLQKLGSLGSEVVGAAALAGGTVLAVVEGNRVASFKLGTRVSDVRYQAPRGIDLAPWLVVSPDAKRSFVAGSDHTVVGFDASGNEDFRASLSGGPGVTLRPQSLDVRSVPPALLGAGGTLAVMTPGWYTLLIDSDGGRREIKEGNCLSPVAITPYGPHKVVTTCRTGEVWLLGDR